MTVPIGRLPAGLPASPTRSDRAGERRSRASEGHSWEAVQGSQAPSGGLDFVWLGARVEGVRAEGGRPRLVLVLWRRGWEARRQRGRGGRQGSTWVNRAPASPRRAWRWHPVDSSVKAWGAQGAAAVGRNCEPEGAAAVYCTGVYAVPAGPWPVYGVQPPLMYRIPGLWPPWPCRPGSAS